MTRRDSLYKLVTALGAITLAALGSVMAFAACLAVVSSPYDFWSVGNFRELPTILFLLGAGITLLISGIATFINVHYGYKIV